MKKLIQVEVYKLKRTKIILITSVLTVLALYQGYGFAKMGKEENANEVFRGFLYMGSMSVYSWLVLPLVITVVLAMMARMEHHNNSWKQLLALPVKRAKVYFAKLLVGIGIIIYSHILLYVGMMLAAFLLGIEQVPYGWVLERFSLMFLSSLAITGLVFYVSYRFSHFGVPMVIGAGLAFPSMFVANSEKYWIFYPWDYPIISSLADVFDAGGKNIIMLIISISIFLLSLFIGFLRFRTKDIL
jgi:hypothetical protein